MCCSSNINQVSRSSEVSDSVLAGIRCKDNSSSTHQCSDGCTDHVKSSSKITKSVSFGMIYIREHRRIIGHHPCVTGGPALSLAWYDETDGCDKTNEPLVGRNSQLRCRSIEVPIDEYESTRKPRKSKLHQLSEKEREKVLMESGYTRLDIYRTMKEIKKQVSVIRVISETVRKLKRSRSTDVELFDLMKKASYASQCLKSSDEFALPSSENYCEFSEVRKDHKMFISPNESKDETDSYLSEES